MGTIHDDGCHLHALDDEPIFTVLARDPSAPAVIRYWATLRLALIGQGEKPLDDHALVTEANRIATEMVAWRDEATDHREWPAPRWKHADQRNQAHRSANSLDAAVRAAAAPGQGEDSPEGKLLKQLINLPDGYPASVLVGTLRYSIGSMAKRLAAAYEDKPKPALRPTGGHEVSWVAVIDRVWQIGNRFRIWNEDDDGFRLGYRGAWVFSERVDDKWSGSYPLQHSLQREMLIDAYREHFTNTVTISMGANTRPMESAIGAVQKALVLSKLAVGLRQVTADMVKWLDAKGATERGRAFLGFTDRINGYATEAQQAIGPEPTDEEIDAASVRKAEGLPSIYDVARDFVSPIDGDPEMIRKVGKSPALAMGYDNTARVRSITGGPSGPIRVTEPGLLKDYLPPEEAIMPEVAHKAGADCMREAIAAMFDKGAQDIRSQAEERFVHSVADNAMNTYAQNLEGWARQIRNMPIPAGCADLGQGTTA